MILPNNENKRNFLALTLLLVPVIFLFGELFSLGIITLKNIFNDEKLSEERINIAYVPDIVTGSSRFEVKEEVVDNKGIFFDKHGLIKTSFTINNENTKKHKGILVTGNSVALGFPTAETSNYLETFVNLLESSIREKDNSYDIVNLSYYGFNSWQEYIQLVRYFNTKENFYDLPSDIKLIASLGGIQDFWNFIDLLHKRFDDSNKYYKANGLMSLNLNDLSSEEFFRKANLSSQGDVKVSLEIFVNSLVSSFKKKSNIYKLKKTFSRQEKFENKKISNKRDYQKQVSNDIELKNLVEEKINITFEEYNKTKQIVINSVARNINAMVALQRGAKTLYVYLPTKFGSTEPKNNIQNRFYYQKLNIRDLGIIENDYKESLISRLSLIKDLKLVDLQLNAKESWFVDESHYSNKGHKKIAESIAPFFEDLL